MPHSVYVTTGVWWSIKECKNFSMEISLNAACLLLSIMIISSEYAMSSVTMTQSNSEVIIEGTTHMTCATSLPNEVHWRHLPAGGPAHEPKEVYAFGKMRSPYKDRFEIQINRTMGLYRLVISRVELTDAGIYTCQEDEGIGNFSQAQLTVLEAGPTCTSTKTPIELIGPNSCNKEQENLTLACSVAYRGNSPPLLEWKMAGADSAITQGVTVERTENRITSHLTTSSQPSMDGSYFICQTTETKYNCTSDVINIIYAVSSDFIQKALIGDTVICTANSSESCSYRWKWFKGDDVLTASNSRTLIPEKSGNFRCEADCIIRNESCTITAGFAYVEDGNAISTIGEQESEPSYVVPIVVPVVICGIIITSGVLLVCLLWRKKRRILKVKESVRPMDAARQDDVPFGITRKKGRSRPKDMVDSVFPVEYDIQKAYHKLPYITKGLNGDIRGPGQYKDISVQCAFERIMYSTDEQTPVNEGEMTKEQKLCSNGRQWMKLDHDNLIKFYDVVLKPPAVFIVKEYTAGGSVRNALKKCTESKENLQMSLVKDWVTQIAQGMNYLHEKNIVHKGLKCAQVLIMEPFDPSTTVPVTLKVSNYNLTSDIETSNPLTFEGMFAWMAPEAILESKYSIYSDIWSYGVTVWEILTTEIPFNNYKTGQIMKGITNRTLSLKTPDTCPQDLLYIFEECFEWQPERRPAFSKILTRLRGEH